MLIEIKGLKVNRLHLFHSDNAANSAKKEADNNKISKGPEKKRALLTKYDIKPSSNMPYHNLSVCIFGKKKLLKYELYFCVHLIPVLMY